MANLTFSKKGVPLGRNKSKAENNSSRWTPKEDAYLRMAVEQGLCAAEVGAKLGRSISSIQSRKYVLGIEGRFTPSPRGLKRTATQRVKRERPNMELGGMASAGIQILKIETGVPIPTRGRNEAQRTEIRKVLGEIKVGQSFVVPKSMVHIVRYLVRNEYDAYRTRISATSPDKEFYRLHRIA
jgi:hypothetical protein